MKPEFSRQIFEKHLKSYIKIRPVEIGFFMQAGGRAGSLT
jgi:hypothetical protein